MDASGKLTPLAYPPSAWMADSKHFLAVKDREIRNWPEAKQLLLPQEQVQLVALAEQFRTEIVGGTEKDLGRLPSAERRPSFVMEMVKMYLAANRSDDVKARVGDKWKEFEGAKFSCSEIILCSIEGRPEDARVIARRPGDFFTIAPSPDSKMVAFISEGIDQRSSEQDILGAFNLYVCEMPDKQPGEVRLVRNQPSMQFGWSADSSSLLYSASVVPFAEKATLGTLVVHKVVSPTGQLAVPNQTEEVAGFVFNPLSRQQWLPGNRIVFTSYSLQLPAARNDAVQAKRWYIIHPDTPSVVSKLFPESTSAALPDDLGMCRFSPDGQWMSAAWEQGRVCIVEVKTGRVQPIVVDNWYQKDHDSSLMVPTWRSATELCLMVPPGSPQGSKKRGEVVLYDVNSGTYKCISKNWPDGVIVALQGKPDKLTPAKTSQSAPASH